MKFSELSTDRAADVLCEVSVYALNILNDEHKIQAELFSTIQSHGWYQTEQAQQQKIQARLEQVTGKNVKLRLHENDKLIGGVVVKIGDKRIDGSVAGRLAALRKELLTDK